MLNEYKLDYTNKDDFIASLIEYLKNQPVFIILDSNQYTFTDYEFIAAWGIKTSFFSEKKNVFEEFYEYHRHCNDLIFGHISYDVKNLIENLSSKNPDYIQFPMFYFFQPLYTLEIRNDKVFINSRNSKKGNDDIFIEIINTKTEKVNEYNENIVFKRRMTKTEYSSKVNELKKHIQLGNIYEVNFCQEFYAENVIINPHYIYLKMRKENPAPFSAFYRLNDKYLICASPERYLKKTGRIIISQPIKGTIRRGENYEEDQKLKNTLKQSEKNCAENIMIVDLVRNDLSRTAEKDCVTVKELCEIYTYPTVHQMISTIQSVIKENVIFTDVIKTTFPMGSMTGAPKIKAMQLIDKYETIKRGLYSGTIGYITPDANFDFNVVIRSLQYNSKNAYFSFITGGAITIQSVPEEEYEECLIKAKGILKTLKARIEYE